MEVQRTIGIGTRLVFPLIDTTARPSYYTGGPLTDASITAYSWADDRTASALSITQSEPGYVGAGLWDATLTNSEMYPQSGQDTYIALTVNADEVDEQTLLVRVKAMEADMTRINGDLVNGNNATLSLKALNINNGAGKAVEINSDTDDAVYITGGGSGAGIDINGGANGNGVEINAGTCDDGHGLAVYGNGEGDGVHSAGGTYGHGLGMYGGTYGHGLDASGGQHGSGMSLIGGTDATSHALWATSAGGDTVYVNNTIGYNALTLSATGAGEGARVEGGTSAIHVISAGGGIGVNIDGGAIGIDLDADVGIDIDAAVGNGVDINGLADGLFVKGGINAIDATGVTNGIYVASDGPGLDINGTVAVDINGTTQGVAVQGTDYGMLIQGNRGLYINGSTLYGVKIDSNTIGLHIDAETTGVLIDGYSAGVQVTSASGDGIEVTSTSGDAVELNGATAGIDINSSLDGINITAGGTGGTGIMVLGQLGNAVRLDASSAPSVSLNGDDDGIEINNVVGIDINSSGSGINVNAGNWAIDASGGDGGVRVRGKNALNLTGTDGEGLTVTGSVNGAEIIGSAGDGLTLQGNGDYSAGLRAYVDSGTDGTGIVATGYNTGPGIVFEGGPNGIGMIVAAGSCSDDFAASFRRDGTGAYDVDGVFETITTIADSTVSSILPAALAQIGATSMSDCTTTAISSAAVTDIWGPTFGEPAVGVPAANNTPQTILEWLWAAFRNKGTMNSSTGDKTYYNSSGTALVKKNATDDATEYEEGEMTAV